MSTKERDLILLATDLQSSSVGLTKQQLKERVEARTGTIPSTRTLDRWLASLSVLGMEIDYTREGVNQTLKIENPNVTDMCGCGESFDIKTQET